MHGVDEVETAQAARAGGTAMIPSVPGHLRLVCCVQLDSCALGPGEPIVSLKPQMNGLTDHLFAMPSFLEGVGRVLDFGGEFDEYNFAETPEETDANAIYSDFCAVGEDMWAAIDQFERDLERGAR